MDNRIKYWVFLCSVFVASITEAQDIHFSQFYQQPLMRNPALAGIFSGNYRVITSYRNQWQSVTVPYKTYCVSAELKSQPSFMPDNDCFTLGIQAARDVAGSTNFSNLEVLPVFSYHKNVSGENSVNYLSVAFMGGYVQQDFDPNKLIMNDQLTVTNGVFSIQPTTRQTFDNSFVKYANFSAGASFNGSINYIDYYIAAGIFHLIKPKLFYSGNIVKLNTKFSLNAGLRQGIGDYNEYDLYADYFLQGGHSSFQTGLNYTWIYSSLGEERKAFSLGGIYRLNDALIPVIGLEWDIFKIGISYDVNISKLVKASQYRGGLELTLSARGFSKAISQLLNGSESNDLDCPGPRFGNIPVLY
ncbi:MAG: type IX secretion system membrane protein PorP/SprF [Ferruginibacter sp.]|nr:type IX secretion system membrane protein PorP/SprF [Ferruginibacter sp.]